jgi:glutamate/tyrosine decarboxylase-like PLP-dependent enzyme
MNLGYIPAAPTRAALAFDAVVSSYNIFAGTWESGAGAIFAENQALAWLVELLGWPKTAGGCSFPAALWVICRPLVTARQFARNQLGRHPVGQWRLASTAQAHSSVQAAAAVLDAEVVIVPENDQGQLTGEALRSALINSHDVFAVVASAGTTNAGIIDDLAGIANCVPAVRGVAACRRRVRWRGSCRIQRAPSLQRNRARRQLHCRPAQVALRDL